MIGKRLRKRLLASTLSAALILSNAAIGSTAVYADEIGATAPKVITETDAVELETYDEGETGESQTEDEGETEESQTDDETEDEGQTEESETDDETEDEGQTEESQTEDEGETEESETEDEGETEESETEVSGSSGDVYIVDPPFQNPGENEIFLGTTTRLSDGSIWAYVKNKENVISDYTSLALDHVEIIEECQTDDQGDWAVVPECTVCSLNYDGEYWNITGLSVGRILARIFYKIPGEAEPSYLDQYFYTTDTKLLVNEQFENDTQSVLTGEEKVVYIRSQLQHTYINEYSCWETNTEEVQSDISLADEEGNLLYDPSVLAVRIIDDTSIGVTVIGEGDASWCIRVSYEGHSITKLFSVDPVECYYEFLPKNLYDIDFETGTAYDIVELTDMKIVKYRLSES